MYFYRTKSDTLPCGIARFIRGIKNKLRTFQPQKRKKNKNSQPQTKFTGSYKKKECNSSRYLIFGVYFSPHQRSIVCEYKLQREPIMK